MFEIQVFNGKEYVTVITCHTDSFACKAAEYFGAIYRYVRTRIDGMPWFQARTTGKLIYPR